MVPAKCLTNENGRWEPLAAIRGTMFTSDAGFSTTSNSGCSPNRTYRCCSATVLQNRVKEVRNAILPFALNIGSPASEPLVRQFCAFRSLAFEPLA